MSRLSTLIALFSTAASTAASTCTPFFNVDLSFPTTVYTPTFSPFEDQSDAIEFLHNTTRRTADFIPYTSPTNITLNTTIAAKYCNPSDQPNGIVQILTHGGGFDHRYWEVGGSESDNNQVRAATAAGYGVLVYDRLGASRSSHPDPYTIVQIPVQVDVLAQLTIRLRDGTLAPHIHLPQPRKIVHVGHSIGSGITSGFIARYPHLSDGVVLTGWSTVGNYTIQFPVATGLRIAKFVDSRKWGGSSTGYWTWIDAVVNEFLFFAEGFFTPEALAEAERTKVPSTIGELGTGVMESPAVFEGPLLVCSCLMNSLYLFHQYFGRPGC